MDDRLLELEKTVNELQNDINFLKEVFEDTRKANDYYKDKIKEVKDLCNNKMKDYLNTLQLFGEDAEVTKISKIERDLAKEIYTMLF